MFQLFVLLLGKRSVKKDVNRIAVIVNVENLQPDSIRGCPRRIVNHASIGSWYIINYYAMTGVGLLCYEVLAGIPRPTMA